MPDNELQDTLNTAILKLKAREDAFKQFESISNLGSWEVDLKNHKTLWSEQTYKIYGLNKEDLTPTLEYFLSHLVEEDLPRAQKALHEAMIYGAVTSFECRVKRDDGKVLNILLNGKVVYDENNIPSKLIGTTQDITQQVSLKRYSDELSQLIEYSSNEIYIVDYNTYTYLYVNKGACDALGYTKDELLSMNIFAINPTLAFEEASAMKKLLTKHKKILNKTVHQRKDGTIYHVQAYIHALKYNGMDAFVIFDTDISQTVESQKLLKEQEHKLTHLVNHDTLTNLPNRSLLKDRLSQDIIALKKSFNKLALLFIDLDQFKKINDSLGHHRGDEVLLEISKKLQSLVKAGDTLARLGGDEFAIILKDINNIQEALKLAQSVTAIIKEPIQISGTTLFISSSIGISLYPQDAKDEHDLIKFADAAMYKAKDEGRDNFQFYSSEMTTLAFERVVMESSLRMAIKENQFVVYYQPQVDALTNTITGMEALVRWEHPSIGLVPPNKFIPLAEEIGLIVELDRIVMKKAMKQFATWYGNGLKPGILALNLAIKQLNSKDFLATLLHIIKETGFNSEWLELEITEGQLMNNPEAAIEKLKQISSFGINIAIDDFGTGYSSLTYLKRLPLDKLKIDKSFVRDLPSDEEDVAITKAIIALTKSLNLQLIAEGVETQEQKEFLINNGCHNIQGFLYAKPMPAQEITKLLNKSNEI
ncbi:EAL domain-containing protein [bacterium]|nr:EAL domain-containing protein [bacterium]MBU1993868.1 EAL domain-containing protein [bacterium]